MKKNAIFLAALTCLTSCSTLVDKNEKDRNKAVKSVAIVGFQYDRERPTSNTDMAKRLLRMDDSQELNHNAKPVADANANHAYALIAKKLQDRMKVTVISQKDVAAQPMIKTFYSKKSAATQLGVEPIPNSYDRFEADGIPMGYYVRHEEKTVLDDLAKKLNVGAIVFVRVASRLDKPGKWTLGMGRVGSESDVSISMYNPAAKDFTMVLNQRGDLFKFGSVSLAGMEGEEEVAKKSYESFESALEKLVERI